MKNLTIILLALFILSCNQDDDNLLSEETSTEIPQTTIEQLISAVENNNNEFNDKTIKLEGVFNFFQAITICDIAPCENVCTEDLIQNNEYLYKNIINPCDGSEIVLTDNANNKVSIRNFPEFTISPDVFLSQDQIEFISTEMEFTAKVTYNITSNFCESTKHPSMLLEIQEEAINQLASMVSGITIIE